MEEHKNPIKPKEAVISEIIQQKLDIQTTKQSIGNNTGLNIAQLPEVEVAPVKEYENTTITPAIVKTAQEGGHPWVVVVMKNNRHHCTGSILNDKWIVTAAHCFSGNDTQNVKNFTIRSGTVLRLDGNEYPVNKIVQHPRWDFYGYKNADIALMKINGTIDMGVHIHPISLPKTLFEEPVRDNMIIAGWGKKTINMSATLLLANEFKLSVIPMAHCAQAYSNINYVVYKSQVCTWNINQSVAILVDRLLNLEMLTKL
ncbi:unnamed protein product [Oppiella nova]|uniref:Peptidase S1 domain-containing protein n=1 Tax=Oppiella nova TaxID=334625 RepID=A0A7R9M2Y8_9ACAR|nr:unnamed protein product [Oppiella nova]CAG2169826.1 unnamed protein product [Oppiella nova]